MMDDEEGEREQETSQCAADGSPAAAEWRDSFYGSPHICPLCPTSCDRMSVAPEALFINDGTSLYSR